ncbi:lipoate--protein ligase [Papillibacter cinnamivorans]|uniref:lipoate--protein ligase n=1 Tax=Papillibacter cinnamivorans DSM 12816 TaxID=1122930 RepID=A0A1W1ZMF4_9FIRM|nr:lipoate--protein ligase [Papillibacter cinnamivorans]SMC49740.1 lipoate-protein ligase A [Papillibacter cinnamivorans DSM 12816]
MISQLFTFRSPGTHPFENQALESFFLEAVPDDACVLYLWRNDRTVVIGKNQNAWKECRVSRLEGEGGHLARRISGGGAVYHDLHNLNFTFLLPTREYDEDRQLEVILRAVRDLGIDASKSGRNDLTAEGRKFSGSAYWHGRGRSLHHGTLLVGSDLDTLTRYLSVSPDKLKSKGVESVRSRVVNLAQLCPGLTVESLVPRLTEAFGEVCGLRPRAWELTGKDRERVSELTGRFSSREWRFGQNVPFTAELSRRFPWGGVELSLRVEGGIVRQAAVYTDAMETELFDTLSRSLEGAPFSSRDLVKHLSFSDSALLADLRAWLETEAM